MHKVRLIACALLLALTCLVVISPVAAAQISLKPEGFNQFAVYMANGVFDPTSPNPDPDITGCFYMYCDGAYFQEVVMGWDAAEKAAEEAAARLFFLERFGVNVDELVASGRISYTEFTIDPRIEYRVYHWAGRKVPAEGWEVRDGGYLVVVLDPEGIELGGEFAGERAVMGSALATGYYNVKTTRPNGQPGEDIVIRYKTPRPSIPVEGPIGFFCEVENDKWGAGLAQGFLFHVPADDGLLRFNIRNVLTFPGFGF